MELKLEIHFARCTSFIRFVFLIFVEIARPKRIHFEQKEKA